MMNFYTWDGPLGPDVVDSHAAVIERLELSVDLVRPFWMHVFYQT